MAKGTVNKAIILGRLGKDPEIKQTQSGMQVASLAVATTELGRKDPNTGQRGQDETEWHRVTLFGKMAENAGQYLRKGSQIYIEGKLKTEKWQDQNGQDRYTTGIIASEMRFIGGGQQQGQAQQNQAQPQQNYQQPVQQAPQSELNKLQEEKK